MKVICISGKAQHGKDTLANILKEELIKKEHKVLIAHFADLVKYICKTFFDWNGEKDDKGRTLLQYVGTDIVRTKYPNFWVEFIISILQLFNSEWDFVIIPDCRFPNEYELFKENGIDVTLLRVERPNFINSLTQEQLNHPSETALDNYNYDYIINKDNTIDYLKVATKEFIDDYLLKSR